MKALAALLLLSLGLAWGASNPPSPSGREHIKKQNADTNQPANDSAQSQRGTENMPLFVKSIPAPDSEDDTRHKHYEHFEKPSLERWIAWSTVALAAFTFFLFVFTALLWIATYRLSKDAKSASDRQAGETEKALAIAKQSADAAKASADALINSEKAHIFVEVVINTPPGSVPGYPLYFDVKLWNHGRTPAEIDAIHAAPLIQDEPPSTFADSDGNNRGLPPGRAIASGNSFQVSIASDAPLIDMQAFNALTKRLYCVGRVRFRDIFGTKHTTEFCAHFTKPLGFVPSLDSPLNRRTQHNQENERPPS